MKLDDYRKYFNQSFDQFIAQHHIHSNKINDVRYEKLFGVSRADLADNQYFFFKDGKLKMIYISDNVVAKEMWS